jgi:protein kinase A
VTSFADDTSLYMLVQDTSHAPCFSSPCYSNLSADPTQSQLEYTPGGEIFSYLRRARRFPFPTVQFYAAEITLILAYLHDVVNVAYRDLKPENILLDANGHLKLVDFGFAKYLPPAPPGGDTGEGGEVGPEGHGRGVTYTLCGTPEYLAPEVIRNQGHGMAVDWWALGILVYEMLIGQPPFWDQNPMRIYQQIVAGHIRFPSSSHSFHINTTSKQFILALCRTDPTQRLGYIAGGSARVMSHQFFDGVDWDALYYKKVSGPIVPRVEWAGDAGNFDDYPDPGAAGESEGERGPYTEELKREFEMAFQDF